MSQPSPVDPRRASNKPTANRPAADFPTLTQALSSEEFLKRLAASHLMTDEEVQAYWRQLPESERPIDGEALAGRMVRDGRLTRYQADCVARGEIGQLVLNDYEVCDYIGGGGMGMVLKARHRRMQRYVAIKLISEKALDAEETQQRFHQEVRTAAQLSHVNIVAAYDAGEKNGLHYLVMEYIDGPDLASIVQKSGRLPVGQALDYTLQAAEGLKYAHSKGVIHRDIKPANLLIDADGTLKILDMGIATLAQQSDANEPTQHFERLTQTGQVMGTCEYMAPEQAIDARSVDARSDIYALGCTLYRLVIGRRIYEGDTVMGVIIAHREKPIPSLCAADPALPKELDAAFRKMVAKKPEDRQQSMAEVIAALEACRAMCARNVAPAAFSTSPSTAGAISSGPTVTQRMPAGYANSTAAVHSAGTQVAAAPTDDSQTRRASGIGETVPGRTLHETTRTSLILKPRKSRRRHRRRIAMWVGVFVALAAAAGVAVMVVPKWELPAQVTGKQEAPPLAKSPFDATQAKEHQKAWGGYLGTPAESANSIGMKFALIPPGEFMMGSPAEEAGHKSDEKLHSVRITKPFYLGIYEVTQAEYEQIMGQNPSWHSAQGAGKGTIASEDTSRFPVENVSAIQAAEFCQKLSQKEGKAYRLPTEAEWEYACRAGTATPFNVGDQLSSKQANFQSLQRTATVGYYPANAFGLCDMHGNVMEWCSDWYRDDYYSQSPVDDPKGAAANAFHIRVARGGRMNSNAESCRSAARGFDEEKRNSEFIGFRVVREL